MADYTGCKCPVCQQPFDAGDDVVVCPECGAPYHRACYQKNAGCLFADRHGAGFEWKPAPGEMPGRDAAGAGEVLSRPAPPAPREEWVSGEEVAYLLFTSGSTGEPKGVAVTAANLESFLSGVLPWYPPEEGGAILHQVSYSFDVSG